MGPQRLLRVALFSLLSLSLLVTGLFIYSSRSAAQLDNALTIWRMLTRRVFPLRRRARGLLNPDVIGRWRLI